jgi:hypothetical protein
MFDFAQIFQVQFRINFPTIPLLWYQWVSIRFTVRMFLLLFFIIQWRITGEEND